MPDGPSFSSDLHILTLLQSRVSIYVAMAVRSLTATAATITNFGLLQLAEAPVMSPDSVNFSSFKSHWVLHAATGRR